jgi:hypothetical protein
MQDQGRMQREREFQCVAGGLRDRGELGRVRLGWKHPSPPLCDRVPVTGDAGAHIQHGVRVWAGRIYEEQSG